MLFRAYFQSICVVVCLGFGFMDAVAQDAAPSTTPVSVADTSDQKKPLSEESVSSQLEKLKQDLSKLKASYRIAQGEEKAILATQIANKRNDLASGLDKLAAYIVSQEKKGEDVSAYRDLARSLLNDVDRDLRKEIETTEDRVSQLLEKRSNLSGAELEVLDREIEELYSKVDEDLAAYLEVVQYMQSQGMDATDQLAFLDGNIQARAERLTGALQFLKNKRLSIRKPTSGMSDEDKQAQTKALTLIDNRIKAEAAHLNATVAIMKERGLDTAAYTQLLIESTGELTQDIFKTEVAFGLLQGWLKTGEEWLIDNGPRWLFKIVVFILVLLGFKLLSSIVKRLVRRAVTTSKFNLSQLLQNQVVSFAGKMVMFLGLLVGLSQLGIHLAPLLAGLGIAGFIVGFALQDTLSNFAAGMMILLYRPYDVGDAVEAGGVTGKVKDMNLVSTTITTWDNQKMVVPNSKIWGDVIRNITAEPHRRIDMTFGIAYADDVDHAERVLWEIVKGHDLVLGDPEPVVRLHALGESSVDFIVRPWAATANYWNVYWDITRAVKKRFDEEGISIPFPQRDVHLIPSSAAPTT
ncbi:MAG: mechanosensitive ion channel domain-containing protein [Candidatus Thiodiazotropha sp.]